MSTSRSGFISSWNSILPIAREEIETLCTRLRLNDSDLKNLLLFSRGIEADVCNTIAAALRGNSNIIQIVIGSIDFFLRIFCFQFSISVYFPTIPCQLGLE